MKDLIERLEEGSGADPVTELALVRALTGVAYHNAKRIRRIPQKIIALLADVNDLIDDQGDNMSGDAGERFNSAMIRYTVKAKRIA